MGCSPGQLEAGCHTVTGAGHPFPDLSQTQSRGHSAEHGGSEQDGLRLARTGHRHAEHVGQRLHEQRRLGDAAADVDRADPVAGRRQRLDDTPRAVADGLQVRQVVCGQTLPARVQRQAAHHPPQSGVGVRRPVAMVIRVDVQVCRQHCHVPQAALLRQPRQHVLQLLLNGPVGTSAASPASEFITFSQTLRVMDGSREGSVPGTTSATSLSVFCRT